ncbi:SCO family protein [Sphingobium sufflavum]|uniref:SCO family protein n=1 Tax=Sphingobium sufflavum TaxID=1129547 RepID=UPI001F3D741B|nr:SCO family protein [Sphingobium sufflavum]MCE7798060.1 SCO family protein [Sphingobium sufflavum]
MARTDRLRLLVLAVFASLTPLALSACGTAPQNKAEGPGSAPFTLSGANGRPVSDYTLKGKPYAIFFGFTRCPDVCPTTLARMAHLRKAMGADGAKFAIVFVSVDPEHDKPADIGRYVDLFGTPIIGATGSKAQIDAITKNFGVFYQKVPQPGGDYTIDHSAIVILMDRKGHFAGTLSDSEDEKASLAKLKPLVA